MVLPEEILRLSDKELDKLPNNVYQSKYVMYNKQYIFKKEGRVANKMYYSDVNNKVSPIAFSIKDLSSQVKPLTKKEVHDIKLNNIIDSVDKMSDEKLRTFYLNKAIEVFGEEYVDLQNDNSYKDGYRYSIIIWIPSVIISNSFEQSLEMKDLYMKLTFSNKRLHYLQFARTTVSERELRNSYIFSHLSHSHIGTYDNDLCMGDTQIKNVFDRTRNSTKHCFLNIVPFYYLLKEYISWESIEGVPYRKIDNVLCDENRFKEADIEYFYDANTVYLLLLSHINDFSFIYNINDIDYYDIKLSDDSKDHIRKVLNEIVPEHYLYSYRNGISVTENFEQNYFYKRYNDTGSEVMFKEENIKNIVIPDDDLENNLEKSIHVDILNEVISKIEEEFSQYIINKKLKQRG